MKRTRDEIVDMDVSPSDTVIDTHPSS